MICRPRTSNPYAPTWHLLHFWSNWAIGATHQERRCIRCRLRQRKALP